MTPPTDAAKLLSVACAEPLTAIQLLERADARCGLQSLTAHGLSTACRRLAAQGLLTDTRGVHAGRHSYLYTLSDAGEARLDTAHAMVNA